MLTVEGVTAGYGEVRVLEGVSLEVRSRQIVALVGSNGAGKSTLVRVVSGLLRPRAGRVRFLGAELTGLPPDRVVAQGVVQVPEGRHLFPEMTVLDTLLVGGAAPWARGRRTETLEEVLGLFPVLRARQRQVARTLSGGEQQMLAIGRALMAQPKLLILDEPSLGLAPVVVRQVLETVAQLRAAGLTVLLIEQNVQQSLALADYAYVLENGRVGLHGPADEVRRSGHTRRSYLGR